MVSGFSIEDILSPEKRKKDVKNEENFLFLPKDMTRHRISRCYDQRYRKRSLSPLPTIPMMSPYPNADDEDDKVTRRPRTSITMCQRDFLEKEFQKERYPTLAYIDKLSRRIHLPQYVIKVWFQNRRAKYRKEGHKRKRSGNEVDTSKHIKSLEIVPEREASQTFCIETNETYSDLYCCSWRTNHFEKKCERHFDAVYCNCFKHQRYKC